MPRYSQMPSWDCCGRYGYTCSRGSPCFTVTFSAYSIYPPEQSLYGVHYTRYCYDRSRLRPNCPSRMSQASAQAAAANAQHDPHDPWLLTEETCPRRSRVSGRFFRRWVKASLGRSGLASDTSPLLFEIASSDRQPKLFRLAVHSPF